MLQLGHTLKKASQSTLLLDVTFSTEPKVKETAALCIKRRSKRYVQLYP